MMILEQATGSTRIEQLRKNINDRDYVHTAIQRIAAVLSNRLMDISRGEGNHNERQWKRGKL